MPALFIRHTVADFHAWKPRFDEHGVARRANGSLGGRVFHGADDPTEVLVLLEWDDLDRARLFVDSDDFREAMVRAGTTGPSDLRFLTDGESVPA
jgi:heme-degrading monooxygenase HmoA